MATKTCIKCLKPKDRDDFYDHPAMKDGKIGKCKECCKEAMRQHREANDSVRERERRRYRQGKKDVALARYRAKVDPARLKIRKQAYAKVQYALKTGRMARAEVCEECKLPSFTEAAHTDYSKPYEVRWLCRRCHRRWDGAEPKASPKRRFRRLGQTR